MAVLSGKIGHFTGWFGRARGRAVDVGPPEPPPDPIGAGVPFPHAARMAPTPETAAAAPADFFRKSRRLSSESKGRRSLGWLTCPRLPIRFERPFNPVLGLLPHGQTSRNR